MTSNNDNGRGDADPSHGHGSRLSNSTWRPSSGPYDYLATPSTGGTVGGTCSTSTDPTPNSLTEAANRVHFTRAEYKPPVVSQMNPTSASVNSSLPNSLEGSGGGGVRGGHNNGPPQSSYGRTPNSAVEIHDSNSNSAYAGYTPGFARHHQAVNGTLQGRGEVLPYDASQYQNQQQYQYQGSQQHQYQPSSQQSEQRHQQQSREVKSYGSYVERYQDVRQMMSSRDEVGQVQQPRPPPPPPRQQYAPAPGAGFDGTTLDNPTPLERWQSRKERKMAEQVRIGRRVQPRDEGGYEATTPPQNRVTKSRSERWSPHEEDEAYDKEDEETFSSQQDGREEYDELGATRLDVRDRHRLREGRNRERKSKASKERSRPDPDGELNGSGGSPLFDDAGADEVERLQVSETSGLALDSRFNDSGRPLQSPGASPEASQEMGNNSGASNGSSYYSCGSNNGGAAAENSIDGLGGSVATSGVGDSLSAASSGTERNSSVIATVGVRVGSTTNGSVSVPSGATSVADASNAVSNATSASSYDREVHLASSQCSSSRYKSSNRRGGNKQDRKICRASEVCERFTGSASSSFEKTKKRYLWATLAVCLACIIAAAVSIYYLGKVNQQGEGLGAVVTDEPTSSMVPTPSPSSEPTNTPTSTPTSRPTSERELSIGEYLHSLSKGQASSVDTPQYQAKLWILYEDDLELHLPHQDNVAKTSDGSNEAWESEVAQRIKQRYALATLYHAMGIGEGGVLRGWLKGDECSVDGFISNTDDEKLAWEGVGCTEDGQVRALVLDGANLHGSIPAELSLLTSIENLIIKNNPGLTGKIPHNVGLHMKSLRQLGLYGNTITGTIPKNVFRLDNLVYLNLADNRLVGTIDWEDLAHHQKNLHRLILQNNSLEGSIDFHLLAKTSVSLLALSNNAFDGHVDDTVGTLSSLEHLYLDGNKLVGSIPDGIGELGKLKALNLDDNELYGTLPTTIGKMTSLEHISVRGNKISGSLPESLKNMTRLKTLNLASNALSGGLKHLSDVPSLQQIHLYQNSLTGRISGEIFSLPNLEVLFLSSNSLDGPIPVEVAFAQKSLRGLYLSDNQLNGPLPEELCSLYKVEDLYLDENDLEGALPLCLGYLSGLKRFHAFKNNFSGEVPSGLMALPHLIELGLEENDLDGGLDAQTCRETKFSVWADCNELNGGCECCERCCSDRDQNC